MAVEQHVIVACHAWYNDMIGGAFRLASEFAEYLAERDYHVSYVCCAKDRDSDLSPETAESGVHIYRYRPPMESLSGLKKLRYHVQQSARLTAELHAQRPVNVLSSHSPLQGLGCSKQLSKTDAFKNYTVHSPFDDELLSNTGDRGPGLMQKLAGRVARWVDGRNVALADRVQTDSRYTLQNFRGKHGRWLKVKGMVAPGWVETDVFVPAENRKLTRGALGEHWDTDLPVLFTLRRLESRMGLDTFIQACDRVRQEGLQFRTLIGGGGSLKDELQRMIDAADLQDTVRLLGRLPEDQLAPSYAAADCFVLPTRALECFGLIVLEAYACDTPVIASSVAAIPELAERQGAEWMFEPGNVDQLADRIRAFVSGTLKPSVNLRELAMEYDKPTILQQWESLLMEHSLQLT